MVVAVMKALLVMSKTVSGSVGRSGDDDNDFGEKNVSGGVGRSGDDDNDVGDGSGSDDDVEGDAAAGDGVATVDDG